MQGIWCLIPPPSYRSVIGSKWAYKIEKNPDGTISRYRARLVAQGYSQEHGLLRNFQSSSETYYYEAHSSLATQFSWSLRQLDIKNAFLHGELEEEFYMK